MATEALPTPSGSELPDELAIDTRVARRIIREFITGHLRQAGFERVILGLSGGIDSALVAYLVSEAVGAERLLCVLMPYRSSSPASRADAEAVVADLGCASDVVDISPMVDAYFDGPARGADADAADAARRAAASSSTAAGTDRDATHADPSAKGAAPDTSRLRRGNFMARTRMAVLYDRSVTWGGLVAGTSNKTEMLIGYTTMYGDNASAFNPIGDLYKSQIRQLSRVIGVPTAILEKAPSADLWPGQTDESEVGFSYSDVDRLLYWMVDRRLRTPDLVARGFEAAFVERVERMVAGAEFKRQVPPIAKLGTRTAGIDYLYPRRRPGSGRR